MPLSSAPRAFLSDPKRSETENKFDIRGDYSISQKDNFFARYSYGKDSNFLPSPFNNVLDGGSFQDGYSDNAAQGLAASEIHTFRNNLINEFRFGFNYLNSHRLNLNYNVNVSQQLPVPFPGVPFNASQDIGGLPSISFSDGTAAIGSSGFLPSFEKQHSYVFTDNLSWTRGRHAAKFGGELRFEQFTILQPAAPRGSMSFGSDFTDNPATWPRRRRGDCHLSAWHSRRWNHHQCDPQHRLSTADLRDLCARRLQGNSASHPEPGPPLRTLQYDKGGQ